MGNVTCYMALLTRFFPTFHDTNNSELERMKAELEKTTEVATNLAIHKIEHDFEERKHKVTILLYMILLYYYILSR